MKTLFTSQKALAVFNCENEFSTDAIRLHLYHKEQEKWVYTSNFTIEQKGIRLENVIKLDAGEDYVCIQTNVKGNKVEHIYNLSTKTCTAKLLETKEVAIPQLTGYVTLKLNELTSKLYSLFKMPQLSGLS